MFRLFANDFKNAPLWQKIVLLVLLGVLFFHLFLRSGFMALEKKIDLLEKNRDQLFRELQQNKYLLEDAKVITKNFVAAQKSLAAQLPGPEEFEQKLALILRRSGGQILLYAAVPEAQLDYGTLWRRERELRLAIAPRSLTKFLQELLSFSNARVARLEYAQGVLSLRYVYVVTKKPGQASAQLHSRLPVKKKFLATGLRPSSKIDLQGFFVSQGQPKAILNNKLYSVGDKYGVYTIIRLDPVRKTVYLANGRKRKIIQQ